MGKIVAVIIFSCLSYLFFSMISDNIANVVLFSLGFFAIFFGFQCCATALDRSREKKAQAMVNGLRAKLVLYYYRLAGKLKITEPDQLAALEDKFDKFVNRSLLLDCINERKAVLLQNMYDEVFFSRLSYVIENIESFNDALFLLTCTRMHAKSNDKILYVHDVVLDLESCCIDSDFVWLVQKCKCPVFGLCENFEVEMSFGTIRCLDDRSFTLGRKTTELFVQLLFDRIQHTHRDVHEKIMAFTSMTKKRLHTSMASYDAQDL